MTLVSPIPLILFFRKRRPPSSPLFPYTTLFRSRSQAACRLGERRSPRRTKENDPRGRRWGGSCAGRDPGSGATAHDPVLDGHGDLGQVGGGGPRQHLAVGGIEAGAVAGAVQLHLVLAQCAAIVGAVPGVGGDVLAYSGYCTHNGCALQIGRAHV